MERAEIVPPERIRERRRCGVVGPLFRPFRLLRCGSGLLSSAEEMSRLESGLAAVNLYEELLRLRRFGPLVPV